MCVHACVTWCGFCKCTKPGGNWTHMLWLTSKYIQPLYRTICHSLISLSHKHALMLVCSWIYLLHSCMHFFHRYANLHICIPPYSPPENKGRDCPRKKKLWKTCMCVFIQNASTHTYTHTQKYVHIDWHLKFFKYFIWY